jgi:hypothetical protein
MVFRDERRQKFLDERRYAESVNELEMRIAIREKSLAEEALTERAISSFHWHIASVKLELLLLHYTAGRPLAELRDQLPAVISAFDAYIVVERIPRKQSPPRNEAETLEITQLEAYVYVMWLLALCRLLGHERLIPKVMAWLDRNAEFNRGRDTIFERVVEKLTGTMQDPGRYSLHIDAYRPLGRAILAEDPADRPALVKEFVENWYKHMKDCYWQGTHTDKEGSSYFGYWCLEAALVTFLWDIDDTSYRDHLVYPKDLVAYARENFPLRDPSAPSSDARLRCPAGQPCPKAGYWLTPAKSDSRHRFKAGEVMPSFGGDYGETIWQWDEGQ